MLDILNRGIFYRYPLLLHLADVGLTDDQWREVAAVLESYVLRRAVCGLTAKNYNRVFLTLTKTLRREGTSITVSSLAYTSHSTRWPNRRR